MADSTITAPPLVFSHFGYYVAEFDRMVKFWTQEFGFGVSDAGEALGGQISFMTRRPFEHHQLVAISGRDPSHPTTVADVGFRAADLAELRRIAKRLRKVPGVTEITSVDHGVSWTLHFVDPTGVPVTIDVETEWFVPQPQAWPLDLDADDDTVRAKTRERCREIDGFCPRSKWRANIAAALTVSGSFQSQATPAIDSTPETAVPVFRNKFGPPPASSFPHVAMFRVGMQAIDLDALTRFYVETLGYLVTGSGQRPAVGALPAKDVVYLTRDPDQVAQLILTAGRSPDVPSSINQVTFRVPSLGALREVHQLMVNHPLVSNYRPVDHGNSFSLYCDDPEGNTLELSQESIWYTPAPSQWPLDFSISDDEILKLSEQRCRSEPGFMLRNDWKAHARAELARAGRLEAEELVEHLG